MSLQLFLPVYGVRARLFVSSLAGECPPWMQGLSESLTLTVNGKNAALELEGVSFSLSPRYACPSGRNSQDLALAPGRGHLNPSTWFWENTAC